MSTLNRDEKVTQVLDVDGQCHVVGHKKSVLKLSCSKEIFLNHLSRLAIDPIGMTRKNIIILQKKMKFCIIHMYMYGNKFTFFIKKRFYV